MSVKSFKNIVLCAALGAVVFLQGCCCMHHSKKDKADASRPATTTEMQSTIPGESVPPPAMY